MPYKDINKRKEAIKQWKEKHKESISKKAALLYRLKHPEIQRGFSLEERMRRKKESQKRYRICHKDEINRKRREKRKEKRLLFPKPPQPKPPQLSMEEKKLKKYLQNKRYRDTNNQIIKIRKAQYYQQNKEKILIKYLEKLKTNINQRLACNIRNRIRSAIKNGYKCGSAVRDLQCSISKFKIYIESLWREGMSWDNYGKYGWHLDHIIPLCKFNLSNRNEFLKATHYTNYQPLWAIENLTKNKYVNSDSQY